MLLKDVPQGPQQLRLGIRESAPLCLKLSCTPWEAGKTLGHQLVAEP